MQAQADKRQLELQVVDKHAILSPSGADRWMTCSGSVALSTGLPDVDNEYSIEGTDLHEVAALCMEEKTDALDYVGQPMKSGAILTEDQATAVQEVVDAIRTYAAQGTLLVEEKVPISHLTGEKDAEGTLDFAVITETTELIVGDEKYGRGVKVEVKDNRQLKIYALGLLKKHDLQESYNTVRLVILQPRAGGTSEWVISMEDLLAFKKEITLAVKMIDAHPDTYTPSDAACRWCRAKAICPELRKVVYAAASEGFEDITRPSILRDVHGDEVDRVTVATKLGEAMSKVDMIEKWCKSIRSACEIELLAGRPVHGWKLVQGKRGNRKWSVEDDVLEIMKTFRMKIEEIYSMKVISPTVAEKLLEKEHPRRWAKLLPLITQTEGVPSVAPESDARPALSVSKPEEGFGEVYDDCKDLI